MLTVAKKIYTSDFIKYGLHQQNSCTQSYRKALPCQWSPTSLAAKNQSPKKHLAIPLLKSDLSPSRRQVSGVCLCRKSRMTLLLASGYRVSISFTNFTSSMNTRWITISSSTVLRDYIKTSNKHNNTIRPAGGHTNKYYSYF